MSSSSPQPPWSRLVAAARGASDSRDPTAPYGFATRVATLAMSAERPISSLFERFALRALGVACLLAIVSVAVNYSAIVTNASSDDEVVPADDPVAVLLDA
jgi:hypothetical protein